jgi:hypothetical protein
MIRVDRSMLAAALSIWAGCGAVMGIGQATTTVDNALVIHAVAAPLIAFAVGGTYFTRSGTDRVGFTALFFMAFAMAVDLVLVALLLMRSLEMFSSPLGTWIPFGSIFAATYLAGSLVASRRAGSASQLTS